VNKCTANREITLLAKMWKIELANFT
jgi:hypothetical protein